MKYRRNLRTYLAFLTLMPGLLCALIMGSYLSYALMRDVADLSQANGAVIGEQLGYLAYQPIHQGNTQTLDHIALVTLENPLVHAISFYDTKRRVLSHAGPRHNILGSDEAAFFTAQTQQIETGRNLQIIWPIHATRLAFETYAHTTQANNREPIGWARIELSGDYLLLNKYKTILLDIVIVAVVLGTTFWLTIPFGDKLVNTLIGQARAALEISRGNHEAFPPDSPIIELRLMTNGIKSMQRAMYDQDAGLQQYIEQSTRDLRENMELIEIQNIELNLARREAVQANKVKSEFLANTSHEIRTPLNSIIGFSRLLEKSSLSMQQVDYLTNIQKSSEGLLTIINDVLDLSKIEAGKLVLDKNEFDLNDTVEDILQILAPIAHEKGLELLHMIYSDVPRHLLGDALRLKQILTNLISNAIKFTDQGRVVVRVALTSLVQQQAVIKVDVTDTGKGLPNNNKAIFSAFNQIDNSSTREHGGTGLGLAICKKLAEQMGGDIGYQSEPGNTTFWFTFRADIETGKPHNAPDALGERHILVCEREPLCRLTLGHSLTRWGVHPVMTEHADQVLPALEHYADTPQPVEVVMIGLPVNHTHQDITSTQALIQSVRSRFACKILLCTPTSSKHNFLDIFDESVWHLPKPATEKRLYNILTHVLNMDAITTTAHTQLSEPHRFQDIHILTVDDNPSNLKLINTILSEMGVNVLTASNGQEAIALFGAHAVDLVFMDIQMPGMDGIETTRRLREQQADIGRYTPVIALTAHALAEERRNVLMSGLDDYLSKPATDEQLVNIIQKWLKFTKRLPRYTANLISHKKRHLNTPRQ
jgi:two-component system sensor histidine kinase BarA